MRTRAISTDDLIQEGGNHRDPRIHWFELKSKREQAGQTDEKETIPVHVVSSSVPKYEEKH